MVIYKLTLQSYHFDNSLTLYFQHYPTVADVIRELERQQLEMDEECAEYLLLEECAVYARAFGLPVLGSTVLATLSWFAPEDGERLHDSRGYTELSMLTVIENPERLD